MPYLSFSMGWERDIPDPRDYTLKSPEVEPFIAEGAVEAIKDKKIIENLRPPRVQGNIGSCVAHAVTYLYESHVQVIDPGGHNLSRMFVYKVMRNILGWKGDRGGFLRTGMQTLAMFGSPPEDYYPYNQEEYEKEPDAFHYAMAQNYQALTYYRLDPFGTPPAKIMERIKANLCLNRACVFGFIVYSIDPDYGYIFVPNRGEKYNGGHAVAAVGYDDSKIIKHPDGSTTTGAIKCANWWGLNFGECGHIWLPYWYVENGLATDWWTMMSAEWLDLTQFGRI